MISLHTVFCLRAAGSPVLNLLCARERAANMVSTRTHTNTHTLSHSLCVSVRVRARLLVVQWATHPQLLPVSHPYAHALLVNVLPLCPCP